MDFEKEIIELDKKIDELKKFSEDKQIDLSFEINRLEEEKGEKLKKIYTNLDAWGRTQIARHPKRPYMLDYVERIVEDFVELHGDRLSRDDNAIVGGLGKIGGKKFVIIGHEKGRTTEQKIIRNFGSANPEGYRKALRLMKLAERFELPVFTIIDTAGAYPGIEAEENGQGEAIARNLLEMAGLNTQTIAIVIGEGGSGGALGLGVSDRVFMLENSYYSVISPEGCASILFRDAAKAPEAAKSLKLDAPNLLKLGVIDGVINEPVGGAHVDYDKAAEFMKERVLDAYDEIKALDIETLKDQRYNKFRRMGQFV